MGFFDKKLKQAEGDAEKLINQYMKLLDGSSEAASIKQMARKGAPSSSIGNRAADTHKSLFSTLLSNAEKTSLLRSATRKQIVEQFCIALWRRHLGDDGYREMTKSLGLLQGPPKA
ncbi:MAG TPA: hypothetical protein VHJ78_10000 [Actinomycetota bacterium]|nr:hypothetical protein [Actinomycetota bacterium]